jgi:acetyltransferase-like isoleucine patch superfamily enzyme
MKRRLEIHKYEGEGNSLQKWYRYRNPLRVIINFLVIWFCKYLPSLRIKNWFYRRIGIKIGKHVSVGLAVTFDIFFPDMIEIGDNCVIGYNTTILCHEFLIKELRKGKVKIGKNVMIGANSTILAGVSIGDNSSVSAMSLVNSDIPNNSLVGGIPAKTLSVGGP